MSGTTGAQTLATHWRSRANRNANAPAPPATTPPSTPNPISSNTS